jgi:hypothetical protein
MGEKKPALAYQVRGVPKLRPWGRKENCACNDDGLRCLDRVTESPMEFRNEHVALSSMPSPGPWEVLATDARAVEALVQELHHC